MPPEEPTLPTPTSMSRPEFNLFFSDLTTSNQWYYADSVLRRDLVGDAFRSVPGIWENIKDRGATWLQNFYDNIVNFAGPPIPEVAPDIWFSQYWYNLIGWEIQWALSPIDPLEGSGTGG